MVGYLAQTLKQTSREATILLYAPALDPHLEKMTELADRVFCIYNEPAGAKGRGRQRRGWPESRGRWRRTREKSATLFLPPRHYRKARGEFGGSLRSALLQALAGDSSATGWDESKPCEVDSRGCDEGIDRH